MLTKKLQEYLKLRNYSPKTIKAYTGCAKALYRYFNKPLNQITEEELRGFLAALSGRECSPCSY